jgi:hypothetical protein
MKKHLAAFGLILGMAGFATSTPAQTSISLPNDPALNGAAIITFDAESTGFGIAGFKDSGVTFSAPGDSMDVDDSYSGFNNVIGNAIDNDQGNANTFKFAFDTPQAAFGFNYGEQDDGWALSAYDSADNLIYSYTVAPNSYGGSGNDGAFAGIFSPLSNIAYGTYTVTVSDDDDFVMLDNFYYSTTTVPEPSALALAGLGGASILYLRRRK